MKQRKVGTYVDFIALITYIIIILKSAIYLSMLRTVGSASINFKTMYFGTPDILAHLVIPIVIISFSYLFKGKAKVGFNLIIDLLISLFFMFDIWYYRANGTFLSIRHLLYPETFNPLGKSLLNFRAVDMLFVVDIIIFVVILLKTSIEYKELKRNVIAFILLLMISSSYIVYAHYSIDIYDKTNGDKMLFRTCWAPFQSMSNMSPLGYHGYDVYKYLKEVKDINLTSEDKAEIEDWLNFNNENIADNEYKGMLEGKNLIAIQVESLENFVIGQKIYDQDLTPNLNKMLGNSLYFSNIHEQNNSGTSSDADLMVNTSVFPIRNGSTFFDYTARSYTTLPNILKDKGYTTMSTHPEVPGNWNWAEAHKGSLGFENILDISYFNVDEVIGLGLSDESYLRQVGEKLKDLKSPFYGYMVTLTSHGPFEIPEDKKYLKLPKELDETLLGGYFQSVRYVDEVVGKFLKQLEAQGMLNNSVIMLYGDHTGIHKFYNDKIQDIKLEGDWWKKVDMKIPYIIYNPSLKGEEIKANGGQVDMLPTISYLLGVDREKFGKTTMGRVLVNTNRDTTVLNSGEIIGTPKNEEEEKHLKETLDVANKIILGDYFKK